MTEFVDNRVVTKEMPMLIVVQPLLFTIGLPLAILLLKPRKVCGIVATRG